MYYEGFHMAQVQTVEQATQLALDLVRKYYSFAFPSRQEERILDGL